MIQTFLNILPVFAIIGVGYGGARMKIIPSSANQILNRFVVCFALPALMFHIVATTDWTKMWDTNFVIASLSGSIITFVAGMAVGYWRGLPMEDMSVDGLNASYCNAGYIGLPLFMLAMGPASMPYIIVGSTITLTLLFLFTVVTVEWKRHRHAGLGHALGKAMIGVIRNPVITSPLIGLAWWLTGIPLPDAIERSTNLLGMAASPTALVAIGLFLAERPLIDSVANRFVLILTTLKLVIHPVITAIIAFPILGMGQFTGTLAVAMAALPTGTGPFMIAALYNRDARITSGTILLSTIISVVTISMILAIMPH